MSGLTKPHYPWTTRSLAALGIKLVMIAALVQVTNFGFWGRVRNLLEYGRFDTLIPFLAVWALAIAALLAASFQSRFAIRLFWALPIALSSTASWVFFQTSNTELGLFDIISLWESRHDSSRAIDFYRHLIWPAVGIMSLGMAAIAAPPAVRGGRLFGWMGRMAWLPVLPVAMIVAIVYARSGGGAGGMPKQFSSLALAAVAAERIATHDKTERLAVSWTPAPADVKHSILLMIDESVRGDYVDLTPGNPHTPNVAALADRLVDFGPAVSGGNCSNYSNAILRFGASRRDLTHSINTSPTIWQYARKAGYRTVFVNAQATADARVFAGGGGKLTNFMTLQEQNDIDLTILIEKGGMDRADFALLDIVRDELAGGKPAFIYVNKNGAHFPYDRSYPSTEAVYLPTMASSGNDNVETRIASYRNAVRWSVDLFMKKLFETADLSSTTMIYTSDHGQFLRDGTLTHCIVNDPDPRVGLVPLMAYTADPVLKARFAAGAAANHGKASHFLIIPAVLELMGYNSADIKSAYDESLFAATQRPANYTSGDIFGLFDTSLRWNPVDLSQDYLEPEALKIMPRNPAASVSVVSKEMVLQ
jgi:glucan phosphoethanolaminetransferase (alkaline phosphatase superfamily)